jgi:hypothetical protein
MGSRVRIDLALGFAIRLPPCTRKFSIIKGEGDFAPVECSGLRTNLVGVWSLCDWIVFETITKGSTLRFECD